MKQVIDKDVLKKFGKGEKKEIKQGGRAVIYQRVSSREQEYGFSPETQKEVCYKWAANHSYEVVKCFEGEHESAKTDANRKRFQTMLKYVKDKKNRIDAVIVYTTSRFSRTGSSSFSVVDELKKRGITIFSATSEYDARTPDGEWMQGVELVNARHQNAVNAKAVVDNGTRALRQGRWITRPPRGYNMKTTKDGQTIMVNQEGELIRLAFRMKAQENLTNEEVRERMQTMGLTLNKQRWSSIFRNIFYAGYFAHPFLGGEVLPGPQEPLVSMSDFLKINGLLDKAHNCGYETKRDKEYAPLLGSIKCPVCGHNLTASLSTKMRKKYGKEIGYYVCSRKHCKCNVPAKKANAAFGGWLSGVEVPQEYEDVLESQLRKAFPILNRQGQEAVSTIKTNLSHKQTEIEKVEYNLATASNPKIQDICTRQLERLEAEKATIQRELDEKNQTILNLEQYIAFGLGLRGNILKMWQLANLGHKHIIQNLVFPNGIVWNKENDDIEPLSKNEFLFTYNLKSVGYRDKENGQTLNFEDLSAFAPQVGLEPTTP
ncbi:MAG: recombinase family protein [Bacteroidales bacterium]|nr:recombinase family protein [Bacteroidales bacterium]